MQMEEKEQGAGSPDLCASEVLGSLRQRLAGAALELDELGLAVAAAHLQMAIDYLEPEQPNGREAKG